MDVYKDKNGKLEKIGARDFNGNLKLDNPRFDGSDYDPTHDKQRLTGQILRIFNLMKDGLWRTLDEISKETNDPHASISAQLRNLRKERFGAYIVEKRSRGCRESGLFEYRLLLI